MYSHVSNLVLLLLYDINYHMLANQRVYSNLIDTDLSGETKNLNKNDINLPNIGKIRIHAAHTRQQEFHHEKLTKCQI